MNRMEITIAGVGGQGSILAGVILGEAAVSGDGHYAAQTQAYSSELRGGYAATWLVLSGEPVVFPRVIEPDIIVAQAQDSISRYAHTLKEGGTMIIDADMVTEPPDLENLYKISATSLSRNELRVPVTANMIMLGAFCKVTGAVRRESLEKTITENVPPGKEAVNLQAFALGFDTVARA